MKPSGKAVARVAALLGGGVAYYAASWLALRFLPRLGEAYAVWLPAGVAVALVLAYGRLPVAGIFAAALAIRLQAPEGTVGLGLCLASLRAIESWACAILIRRVAGGGLPRRAGEILLAAASVLGVALAVAAVRAALPPPAGFATGDFRELARAAAGHAVGDCAGILMIAPPLVAALERARRRDSSEAYGWPVVSFVVGLALSSFLALEFGAEKASSTRFREEAREMAKAAEGQIRSAFRLTRALHALYAASEDVEPGEFKNFVSYILAGDRSAVALGWNQRVRRSERAAYERMLRGWGAAGPVITELGPDGATRPAGDRDEYYPMTLLESDVASNAGQGFDSGSSPPRLEAIERARDTGSAAVTAPIAFAYDPRGRIGFLVVEPVYRHGAPLGGVAERRASLQGLAIASCVADDWLEIAFSSLESHQVDLYLYDVTERSDPILLAYRPPRAEAGPPAYGRAPSLGSLPERRRLTMPLSVGGRDWLLAFLPSAGRAEGSSLAWLSLSIGLVLSGGILLFESRSRASKEAIARYAGKLEATLDALPHILFEVDDAGVIVEYRAPSAGAPEEGPDRYLGRRYDEAMPPDAAAALEASFAEAARAGRSSGASYCLRTAGGERWYEISASPRREPGKARPSFVVMAQDIGDRKQAESLQEVLYGIASAARTAPSLENLYAEIHRRISGAMSARNFFIVLWEEAEGRLKFAYVTDERDRIAEGDVIPPGDGLTERVLRSSASLLYRPGEGDFAYRKMVGAPPKVWLGVPLVVDGKTIGVMGVQDYADEDAYTSRERRMLEFVSSQVAAAIDLRRTEDEVRLVEARNAAIIENAPDGIVLMDAEGRITFGSPSAFRSFGFPSGECVGRNARRWLHPGDARRVGAKFRELAADPGKEFVDEHRFRRKDGSYRWVRGVFTNLLADPAVRAIVDNFHDVTETKSAQLELEELARTLERRVIERTAELSRSESTYRALFDDSQEGILLLSAEGEAISANRSLGALLGFGLEDYVALGSRSFRAFARGEAEGAALEAFDAALRGEEVQPFEAEATAKDGRAVAIEAVVSPIRDADGTVSLVQLMLRDVGARKKAEAALRESRDRMAEANAALERAARMKDEFFANMSHEIRTPMNAIIGLSSLALKTELTERQRDYVSKVRDSGISLLGIINDILDFSKMEAGKLRIETIYFELEELIASLGVMVSQKVQEKGLEFLARVKPDVPRSWSGDPLRLGQVLLNLVSNAVKFTERGEIELAVSSAARGDGRRELLFEVRDTGIGIAPEAMDGLFKPFTQADSSTTRKFGGTGLGLSICKLLVELMGGRIWVESEPGKGSVFRFTVMLELAPETASRISGIPPDVAGLRVLVVDDNAAARSVERELAAELGFRVEVAESGEEALEAIRREHEKDRFGLVLMDLYMPGMNGIEATEAIKRGLGLADPPLVFVTTGSAGEELRPRAALAGADDYLMKPMTAGIVAAALRKRFAPRAATVPSFSAAEPARRNLSGIRVLLVEDNEINRQIAFELLRSKGVVVSAAFDGSEAVDAVLAAPGRFDLVLMDIQMPVMDGYEAARRIRSDGRFAALPIVAMTAYAADRDRLRALDAGMNGHIAKPFDPEALFDTLAHFCGVAADRSPAPPAEPPASGAEPPELSRIDAKEGLTRVAGDLRLYLDLLRRFARGERDAGDRIRLALASGDATTAERIAHTLKGTGGNLGAREIRERAAEAEAAIRDGLPPESVAAAVEALAAALARAVAEIEEKIPSPDEPPADRPLPVEPARLSAILAKLSRLAADNDTEALDFLRASRAEISGGFGAEAFSSIEGILSAYDFAAALRWIGERAPGGSAAGGSGS